MVIAMEQQLGPASNGFTRGFDAYLSPSAEDFERVLTSGLVVLDTNVLLNLYRYSALARDEFLAVLQKIGSQIWLPHQVLAEFWRRRESAVPAPIEQTHEVVDALERALKAAQEKIRHWAGRTG